MKTRIFNILILLAILPIYTYSQFTVERISTPRITGQNSTGKEIYAIINNPQDGSSFKGSIDVNGIARNIPANNHLWLVVNPRESIGYWPQYKEIIRNDNSGAWNGKVSIGGDDGKLLDILLVSVNSEANNYFTDYIATQEKSNFPARPLPEGTKALAHITVIKSSENSLPRDTVNRYYGFTKTGVFYIHKSLITQSSGEAPCLVAGVTNWTNNTKMILNGEYYVYEAKIDRPYNTKLEYCFYIGNGKYIPQILLEKASKYILTGDYKSNSSKDGSNFYTTPQDYYPINQN